ncbi:MAG: alpha/beta hydrolase [Armatimonas sp.]
MTEYARRVAEQLRSELPFTIGGASFGGMVAHEVAGLLGLETCLLLSTVRGPEELPPLWDLLRPYAERGEDAIIEASINPPAGSPPSEVARWRPLGRPAARFQRWSATAILTWQPSLTTQNVRTYHLHGDKDDVFPIELVHPDEVVEGGGHVLPVTHPERVTAFLKRYVLSS